MPHWSYKYWLKLITIAAATIRSKSVTNGAGTQVRTNSINTTLKTVVCTFCTLIDFYRSHSRYHCVSSKSHIKLTYHYSHVHHLPIGSQSCRNMRSLWHCLCNYEHNCQVFQHIHLCQMLHERVYRAKIIQKVRTTVAEKYYFQLCSPVDFLRHSAFIVLCSAFIVLRSAFASWSCFYVLRSSYCFLQLIVFYLLRSSYFILRSPVGLVFMFCVCRTAFCSWSSSTFCIHRTSFCVSQLVKTTPPIKIEPHVT